MTQEIKQPTDEDYKWAVGDMKEASAHDINKPKESKMSNWKFFIGLVRGYKKYFKRPLIKVIPERDDYLSRYPEAWAYYEPDQRTMFIVEEFDNPAVRIHEYGHWMNACIYFCLEIAWEFIWWGIGLRSICKNRGGKIRK